MDVKLFLYLALVALVTGGPVSASVSEPNFCQGCRALVSFVRVFNTSEQRADYKELFENYCELYYPASTDFQQGPCALFVEGLYYAIEHTDPVQHCDQIGACDPAHEAKLIEIQPSDDIYEYLKRSNAIKPQQRKRGDDVVCEFCEQIINTAKSAVEDPAFIDMAKRQLDAFCDYLKVVDQDKECRQFLDKYIDEAFAFIRAIDPKAYCKSIQLCPASASKQIARSRQQGALDELAKLPSLASFRNFGIETSTTIGERPASKLAGLLTPQATDYRAGPNCMLCKTVVKELFNFLRENKTEANIIAGLQEICGLIYKPGTKRDQCDSMIKAYTRELVQLMIDETDPEVICMLLEQCTYNNEAVAYTTLLTSTTSAPVNQEFGLADLITALDSSVAYKSTAACFECKMFLNFLKQRLSEPRSQAEVKDWLLKNLCKEMPSKNLVSSCSAMVEKNAETFFKALVGDLHPHTACIELGVCSSILKPSWFNMTSSPIPGLTEHFLNLGRMRPVTNRANNEISRSEPKRVSGQTCDQCVEVVSQIDDYLSSHPVDQDVSVIIDKVCNNLPEGTLRDECTFIVKQFGAEIIHAIASMDNPRQLCSKIFLC